MRVIWPLAEGCNFLMALPNLLALVLLSGEAARMTKIHLEEKGNC